MFICEDEDLLSLLREIVERFREIKADFFTSFETAYSIFETGPEAFEFVITDADLPETVSFDFSCRHRPLEPVLKILLSAGIETLSNEDAVQKGFCPALPRSLPYQALQCALAPATLRYREKFHGFPNGLRLVHTL